MYLYANGKLFSPNHVGKRIKLIHTTGLSPTEADAWENAEGLCVAHTPNSDRLHWLPDDHTLRVNCEGPRILYIHRFVLVETRQRNLPSWW